MYKSSPSVKCLPRRDERDRLSKQLFQEVQQSVAKFNDLFPTKKEKWHSYLRVLKDIKVIRDKLLRLDLTDDLTIDK